MPDQKPPRRAGDERATLTALLQYQRDSLVRKVTGIDEGDARRVLVGSGTTVLWLVEHLTQAESLWVLQRFAGLDEAPPGDPVAEARTLTEAIDAYRAMWARVDDVVARSSLDERCRRPPDDEPVDLRWVLAHLLEETARHAGHADILCELIDGRTGR